MPRHHHKSKTEESSESLNIAVIYVGTPSEDIIIHECLIEWSGSVAFKGCETRIRSVLCYMLIKYIQIVSCMWGGRTCWFYLHAIGVSWTENLLQ